VTIERIAGAGLTDALDCNVYAIHGRDRSVLVDAGAGRVPLDVPDAVDAVILTHLHADHAAGAQALGRRGLAVLAHPWTAEGLATGDEERSGLARARGWGMYPPDQTLPAWSDVQTLDDGAAIDLGGCRIEVVETPGHADGHISLLVEEGGRRSLIAGDLVFPGGTISLQVMPDCSIEAIWHSIERVRELAPDALYAGHLAPVTSGALEHLDKALAVFGTGFVPPSHD
jgi:hydroxyacylglutathione hydrolase